MASAPLSDLFSGSYLFHLHTNYTDGKASVEDYFSVAKRLKVSKLIFLEHIRKDPLYDVDAFVREVRVMSEREEVEAAVGFEAKILSSGELDIDSEHLALADVIGIAEHGFPNDEVLFLEAWQAVIAQMRTVSIPKVWVHPGLFFRKNRLLKECWELYFEMLQQVREEGIFIEYNHRYQLLPKELIEEDSLQPIIFGVDAHRLEDLDATKQK